MAEISQESDTKTSDSSPDTKNGETEEKKGKLPLQPLPENYHFHQLLLDIGEEIDRDTLENIKSLYKSELKRNLCEKINHPRELFDSLEKWRFVVPENMVHLQKIVIMIKDINKATKLMTKIHEYSEKNKAVHYRPTTDEPANGYRRFRCHIKGLEHFSFERKDVEELVNIVSTYTGLDRGEILVDGIEITNSIYVSLLIPEAHYRVFQLLLQSGSALWDSNVDMVTFDDETTLEVSTGKKVEEDLPPVYESPEEKIQKLKQILEIVQMENIDNRREIEQLSGLLKLFDEEESADVNVTFQQFSESMKKAENEEIDRKLLQHLIQLNTKLVKGLEKKKLQAVENKLKSKLDYAKAELTEYELALRVEKTAKYVKEENGVTSSDEYKYKQSNVGPQKAKTTLSSDDTPGPSVNEEKSNRAESRLDITRDALKRAEDLGYSKEVIRQIVANTTIHVERSTIKACQAELKKLTHELQISEERMSTLNSLLQLTLPAFGFKQSLMKQLEMLFKSKGQEIPVDGGYKTEIINLALKLGNQLSPEDKQILERGYTDVPVTAELKHDRRLLLLRLFYLENLNSDILILIEDFISEKLTSVGREDLNKDWRERVTHKRPSQQILQDLQMLIGGGELVLRPEVSGMLAKVNAKLSDSEKSSLRRKLPALAQVNCPDEVLLQVLVHQNLNNFNQNREDLLCYVKDLLKEIQREELYQEFEKEFRQLGLEPPIKDILRMASTSLSETIKKKLRQSLQDPEKCKDDDDVLERMILEYFKDNPFTIEQMLGYLKKILGDMNKKDVYDKMVKELKTLQEKGSYSQSIELGLPMVHQLQQEMQELNDKIKSMKHQQRGPGTTVDIMNKPAIPRNIDFTFQELIKEFFSSTMNTKRAGDTPFGNVSSKSNPFSNQQAGEDNLFF